MKERVVKYKNSMVNIFKMKYGIDELIARKWMIEYDFNYVLSSCNYVALHDDPEFWVDAIYQWKHDEDELLEM